MSLKHAILAMLEIKVGTGYDIVGRFKESIGCFWSASHQQVYKELSELARNEWVSYQEVVQQGKPAKIYQVTESGRDELNRWLMSSSKPGNYKDPFLVKVYAGAHMPAEKLMQDLSAKIAEHRITLAEYQALDSALRSMPPLKYEKFRFPHATLRFGLRIEQAWLEWALELQEQIKAKAKPTQAPISES